MAYKKGESGNTKGKPKGLENKSTTGAKEVFIKIMEGEVSHIKQSLESVRHESPAKYLDVLSKLMPYFMPKQVDIKTDGQEIKQVFMIGGQQIEF